MDLVEILTERSFLWLFPRASCWGLFFRLNFMFFENWSIIRPEWWLQFALRHEETMWFLYLNSGLTCLPMLGADNKTTSSSRTKWRLFSASTCKKRPLHFFFYFEHNEVLKYNHVNGNKKVSGFTGQLIILFCKSWRNFSLSRRSLYYRRTKQTRQRQLTNRHPFLGAAFNWVS